MNDEEEINNASELNAIRVVTRPMSSNHIRNFTFEQFFDIFKTDQLDISQFWLINSGFDVHGQKRYVHLILRGCLIRPLFGPHLVSVFEREEEGGTTTTAGAGEEYSGAVRMRTLWVHSLTDLRRNLFQFHDRLSFERSSYLIPYPNGELLIRLKSIRAFICTPTLSPSSSATDEEEAVSVPISPPGPPPPPDLAHRDKVKMLLNHHVQIMISYLNRELGLKSLASIAILKDYVAAYCDELNELMNSENK
jgi:hypothetical protein